MKVLSCLLFILSTLHSISADTLADCNDFADIQCKIERKPVVLLYVVDKRYFFNCDGSGKSLGCQKCPGETLFYSLRCKICVAFRDLGKDCPPKETTKAPDFCGSCIGKDKRTYQAPNDKTKFFSCVNGEVATPCIKCPGNLEFDETCIQCVKKAFPYNPAIATHCPSTGGNPPTLCNNRFCTFKKDGDYEKERGKASNEFHSCSEGACYVRKCPSRTFFAETCNNRCVNVYAQC